MIAHGDDEKPYRCTYRTSTHRCSKRFKRELHMVQHRALFRCSEFLVPLDPESSGDEEGQPTGTGTPVA